MVKYSICVSTTMVLWVLTKCKLLQYSKRLQPIHCMWQKTEKLGVSIEDDCMVHNTFTSEVELLWIHVMFAH